MLFWQAQLDRSELSVIDRDACGNDGSHTQALGYRCSCLGSSWGPGGNSPHDITNGGYPSGPFAGHRVP